jgi:hypothetical protein
MNERPIIHTMEGFAWPDNRECAVTFTFDDARESQLDYGIPALERFGLRATFFVLPKPITSRSQDWKKVAEAGHELGNHTSSHPCSGNFSWSRSNCLEEYTLPRIAEDIDRATQAIRETLQVEPTSFAYPCYQSYVGRGREQRSYVPVVAERFECARAGQSEECNDPAFLHSSCIDGWSVERTMNLIEKARTTGRWLILVAHDSAPGENRQGVDCNVLAEVAAQVAKDNRIWCETMSTVARRLAGARKPK